MRRIGKVSWRPTKPFGRNSVDDLNSLAETTQWPSASSAPQLAADEVHVWAVSLCARSGAWQALTAALSLDEKERAGKFKFEKHRNRFIAGRGGLREILGKYLQAKPAALRFTYSNNGKPALAAEFAGAGVHFNVAHSEDLALVAVTRIGAIGVDVECIRPVKEMDELVARFFSARETELFRELRADEKPAAFFNLWTRKEALLKVTGEGITRSLSLVEVSFLPGEVPRLLAIAGDTSKASRWTLRELSPAPGFTGALTIQAQDVNVRCGKWDASQ